MAAKPWSNVTVADWSVYDVCPLDTCHAPPGGPCMSPLQSTGSRRVRKTSHPERLRRSLVPATLDYDRKLEVMGEIIRRNQQLMALWSREGLTTELINHLMNEAYEAGFIDGGPT